MLQEHRRRISKTKFSQNHHSRRER